MARLVTISGLCGPDLRRGSAMPASSLLEFDTAAAVVDCGLGVTRGLLEAGIDLRDLPPMFITSLHSDHMLELGPLLHTAWAAGLRRPVDVYGPPGVADYWRTFCAAMVFDHALREDGADGGPIAGLFHLHEIGEGTVHDAGGLRVAALRLHDPTAPPRLALRFDAAGKRVTLAAGRAVHELLAGFAWGSDLLVHQATPPEAEGRPIAGIDSSAADAGRLAGLAAVRRLVLQHPFPAADPGLTDADRLDAVAQVWDGRTVLARDGLEIAF